MVFIENRIEYLKTVFANKKLNAFHSLLYSKSFELEMVSNDSEINSIYFGVVKSIMEDSIENFNEYYSKLISRIPNKDFSPFIQDDFFVFCLIVCIAKFQRNIDWIKKILLERHSSRITTTFKNIINKNFTSTDNLFEIIIVFKYLLNEYDLKNYILDEKYLEIVNDCELFDGKNDFLIMIKLRALDCIMLLKNSPDTQEYTFLKNFETSFLKRTKQISTILYCILLSTLIYYLTVYVWSNKWLNDLFQNLGLVLTFFGVGIFGWLFKWLRNKIEKIIELLLGYKNNK